MRGEESPHTPRPTPALGRRRNAQALYVNWLERGARITLRWPQVELDPLDGRRQPPRPGRAERRLGGGDDGVHGRVGHLLQLVVRAVGDYDNLDGHVADVGVAADGHVAHDAPELGALLVGGPVEDRQELEEVALVRGLVEVDG